MKEKLVLFLLVFLFSGSYLIEQRAYASSQEDISIVEEDGFYRLCSNSQSSSDDQLASHYPSNNSAVNPFLRASLEKFDFEQPGVYKTYFAPGEQSILWAFWEPFSLWGISVAGHELTVTVILKDVLTRTVAAQFTHTEILADNGGLSGIGHGFTIPSSAQDGTSYILTVKMTVSGVTLTSPTSTKKLYVTTQSVNDLQLPAVFRFSQNSWIWATDQLGTCPNTTIGNSGSATTSKAFLFKYFGTAINPLTLDTCLTQNSGYLFDPLGGKCRIPGNQTNPSVPGPLAHGHFKNEICAPAALNWDGFFSTDLTNRINDYLNSGFPVIAKTTYGAEAKEHFVVVVGRRGNKWDIFDPLDGHYHMKETRHLGALEGVWLFSQ
jgi:hypothetical protein